MKYEVYFILHIQPLKMEQIECSETSAYNNQTPGKYPKEYILDSKHGESLKSRISASSWWILINKYIEMRGQQNI